jgi:hypothetical protein
MRVSDENLWNQQRTELSEDQTGKDFLGFVEYWVDLAEDLMAEGSLVPSSALRQTLHQADQALGRVSIHFLGQMLVVIATHWEHGQEMIETLTPIELRLVQDMLALKFVELEKQAEGAGNG